MIVHTRRLESIQLHRKIADRIVEVGEIDATGDVERTTAHRAHTLDLGTTLIERDVGGYVRVTPLQRQNGGGTTHYRELSGQDRAASGSAQCRVRAQRALHVL